jgi:hypothetical protein
MNATFNRDNKFQLEQIVVTPEIQAYAARCVPLAQAACDKARALEHAILASSTGEASWSANGGHRVARSADHAALVWEIAGMLSRGINFTHSHGGIDRREWKYLTEAFPDA